MQTAVYTTTPPDSRFTKKKDTPSSGMTVNLYVDTLEELNNAEKIEESFKESLKDFMLQFSSLEYYITIYEAFSIPKPVYVKKNEKGEEVIVYDSNLMELDKLYEIEWEGEKWALRKTRNDIEFQKWEPDSKDKEK